MSKALARVLKASSAWGWVFYIEKRKDNESYKTSTKKTMPWLGLRMSFFQSKNPCRHTVQQCKLWSCNQFLLQECMSDDIIIIISIIVGILLGNQQVKSASNNTLSGWIKTASFLYCFLMSSSVASLGTPRTLQVHWKTLKGRSQYNVIWDNGLLYSYFLLLRWRL